MKFEQFISLGLHCFTAASMSKYGLRSSSGPFDWLITADFGWVLRYMETDFSGFLDSRNLKRWNNVSDQFVETQSRFVFLHDQEYPFEEQYDALKAKYEKKIRRFQANIERPTCFVRICSNEDEVAYIIEAAEYINYVIKRKNANSEIVFLIADNLKIPSVMPFRYYVISAGAISNPTHERLRNAFDEVEGFLQFCAAGYDVVSVMDNLIFDRKKEAEHLSGLERDQKRYDTLRKLVNTDFVHAKLPSSIIIYGAGAIGRCFYEKIRRKCRVVCFVDQEKQGSIDGIPIKKMEEIGVDVKNVFIVTATYDYRSICDRIRSYGGNAEIMSLDDLTAGEKE